jgi:hypothetical protein
VPPAVLRGRLEAHYWFLVAQGLRGLHGLPRGPGAALALQGGTVLASRVPGEAAGAAQAGAASAASAAGAAGARLATPGAGEGAAWEGHLAALEARCREAENRICMQAPRPPSPRPPPAARSRRSAGCGPIRSARRARGA